MEKVSVVMITRNEEKHMEKCLESINWADDIVIVDSFSEDKTVEIAKKFNCKVFQKDFIGFGPLKNYAVSKASNRWILNLDADERITPELENEIRKILENPDYDGYYISRKSYIGKKWIKHAGQWPDHQLRLFRKDKGKFQEKMLHERVEINGKIGYIKNPMLHYNFLGWTHYIKKMNSYTTREAHDLLSKKFVWLYPWKGIKAFFREYRKQRSNGNSRIYSYVLARNSIGNYELKWTVPFKPFYAFFRFYVVQQGFRDGMHGFVWAVVCGFYRFMKYVKYHEMKNDMERKVL